MLSPGECCSLSLTGLLGKVFKVIKLVCVCIDGGVGLGSN